MINENYKGKLLISSPEIADGIFDKSIILICKHDTNGTIGFNVILKPKEKIHNYSISEYEQVAKKLKNKMLAEKYYLIQDLSLKVLSEKRNYQI